MLGLMFRLFLIREIKWAFDRTTADCGTTNREKEEGN